MGWKNLLSERRSFRIFHWIGGGWSQRPRLIRTSLTQMWRKRDASVTLMWCKCDAWCKEKISVLTNVSQAWNKHDNIYCLTYTNVTQMWHKCDTNVTQMWHKCDTNVTQCDTNVTQMWHKCDTNVTQMWHKCDTNVTQMWCKDDSYFLQMWHYKALMKSMIANFCDRGGANFNNLYLMPLFVEHICPT
jgi:hypothetical protein